MAATIPCNKSPYLTKWMAQTDPPKESRTYERMNARVQLLSSNKVTQYFKEWTTNSK